MNVPHAGSIWLLAGTVTLSSLAVRAVRSQAPESGAEVVLEPFAAAVQSGVAEGLPPGPIHSLATSAGEFWAASVHGVAWFDQFRWRQIDLRGAHDVRGVVALADEPYVYAWGPSWIRRLSPAGAEPVAVDGDLAAHGVVDLALVGEGLLAMVGDGRVLLLVPGEAPRETLVGARWLAQCGHVAVCQTAAGLVRWDAGAWREGAPGGPALTEFLGSEADRVRPDGRRFRGWVSSPGGPRSADVGVAPLRAAVVDGAGRRACVSVSGDVYAARGDRWDLLTRLRGESADVQCIQIDGRGRVWVGTAGGVSMLRAQGGTWGSYEAAGADHGAVRVAVAAQAAAADPPSWVSPIELVIAGRLVETIDVDGRSWRARGCFDVCFDDAGDLWVAPGQHMGGVLRRSDGEWQWQRRRADDGVAIRGVTRIIRDAGGILWMLGSATSDLLRVDGRGGVRRWEHSGGLGGAATDVTDDGTRLWFAVPKFGVMEFHKLRRTWAAHPMASGARAVEWDAEQGRVWFVNGGGGIGWIASGLVEQPDELADVGARAIVVGGDRLWVLGGASVGSYDGRRFHAHRLPAGLDVRGEWDTRPNCSIAFSDGRLLFPSATGVGVYAPPVTPSQPFRVGWDVHQGWLEWEVQPHVAIDAEVHVRHRFGSSPWTPWQAARRGELALPEERPADLRLQTEISAGLARTEVHEFRVPAPQGEGWPPLALVGGGLALAGILLAWVLRGRAEELRASRRLYRELVDGADELICVLDPDGLVRSANPAAHAMLGLSPIDLDGVAFQLLVADPAAEDFGREFRACLAAAATREFRSILRRSDGGRFAGEVQLCPLRRGGRLRGVRCVVRDLTARDRVEAQRSQGDKMSALGQMAGGVAHDFNNILQVIHGYSESLVGRTEGELRALAQEVLDASLNGSELVSELALFSRRDRPLPEAAELNGMLRAECSNVRQLVGDAVRVSFDLSDESFWVRLSRSDLQRILLNLAANARDALPAGGELNISTVLAGEADLERLRGGRGELAAPEGVVLVVRDNGPGMDEETRLRVFDPFYTSKPLGQGTGLGLSTVYGVVVAARGVIGVISEPGQGAEFRVVLPREPRPVSAGARVLLVEDDSRVRAEVARLLRACGCSVIEADGLPGARDACETSGSIDLIVADVLVAEETGPSVVDAVRRYHPDVPALFVSGVDHAELERRGISIDSLDLVRRPLQPGDLGERVNALLRRGR